MPLAKELTGRAIKAAVEEATANADQRRLSMALAFVVNAMQRHAIRRGVPDANNLEELPGIEQVVSAVAMLAERADLEVSPFVADWDPTISAVDPDGREIDEYYAANLAGVLTQHIGDALGGGRSTHGGAIARSLGKAVDSYMSAPAIGSGTFTALQGWLTRQVLADVDNFSRTDTTVDYLRPLVRWAASNRAVVSTLNYDECFETAAEHAAVPVDLAVGSWPETGRLTDPLDGPLRLLKLHGSVKWCFVGQDFRVDRPPNHDSPYVAYEPGIVYGQRGKLRPAGPFLQLLEAFRTELERSAKLLVIGYSFGDDHINTLVRNWLARNESRRMLVVEPHFPKYGQNPWDGFAYVHASETDPLFRPDARREMWHAYGPGRPRDEQRQATRHDNMVQVPRPPLPSQLYVAPCGTREFLADLEDTPIAMDGLFAHYKKDTDPDTVDTFVYPEQSGS